MMQSVGCMSSAKCTRKTMSTTHAFRCAHAPYFFCVLLCFFVATPLPSISAAEPAVVRLTTDGHLKERPVWSPDGKSLLFTRHEGATIFLYVRSTEDKTERRLTMGKDPDFDATYSADGKRIAYSY